jgi:hypothetical protein
VKHPPYHMRLNKAIDRYMLVDLLQHLYRRASSPFAKHRYVYYGLGGPFLEDFRLLAQYLPGLALVSIESNRETHRRQKSHRCARNLRLHNMSIADCIAREIGGKRIVFWLDYTDFKPERLTELQNLLAAIRSDSLVKITVRAQADGRNFVEELAQLKEGFGDLVPAAANESMMRKAEMPKLIQAIVRNATASVFKAGGGRSFEFAHSCYYDDQTQMLSVTGVVCDDASVRKWREHIAKWEFRSSDWNDPQEINVPSLSVREKMRLESSLPAKDAKALVRRLGYKIDDTAAKSASQLEQYARFHRFYPVFSRVSAV